MNTLIIEQFNLLVNQIQAEYLNAQVENDVKEMKMHSFRLQQVKKILNIIKKLDFKIKNADQLKGIPGIGAGTLRRIEEIMDKGYLSEIQNKYTKTKQKKIDSIQELQQVIGIGKSFAKKLVTEYKITSIADLKRAQKSGKIELNEKILLGLKYYGVVQGNIPRKEIVVVEKYLFKEAHKIDPNLQIMICGSYRRGKPTSGDIDVLMFHPDMKLMKHVHDPKAYGLNPYLEEFVNQLKKNGFLLDDLTDKNYHQKYMGFMKYKNNPVRRIDILLIPYKSIYPAMLYFTGPYELNTEMRHQAKKRGMILNEYGLYKIDDNDNKTLIKINSEEDIFKKLGMKYLTPTERESFSSGKKNNS